MKCKCYPKKCKDCMWFNIFTKKCISKEINKPFEMLIKNNEEDN